MQVWALDLKAHVRNLGLSCQRGEVGMAHIALERCLRIVEAEGSEIPIKWQIWRVEIELARGNWDGTNSAVKCVVFFLFSLSSFRLSFPMVVVFFLLAFRGGSSFDSDALRLQSNSPDMLAPHGFVLFLCG